MTSNVLRIGGFGDAAAAVIGLKNRFGHAHAVAVLDDEGIVLDLTAFTGARHTMDTALDWANCCLLNEPEASRFLLLSAVDVDVQDLREDDIRLFQLARRVFGERGVQVIDWVQADDENVRSLAISCDVDPPWRCGK